MKSNNLEINQSIKIKNTIRYGHEKITVHSLGMILLFANLFLPNYFGIALGGLPSLSIKRIILIFLWLFIYHDKNKRKQFLNVVLTFKFKWIFLFYMFVNFYTGIFRGSINTIFQPFINYIGLFFTMVYLFKYEISFEEFLNLVRKITLILCILGIIEYIVKFPLFSVLETIPGMFSTGARDGTLRIMGPCNNPLGYGLYLNMLFPLIAYDYKNKCINILKNKTLVLLIILNVFLINSRLASSFLILELFLLIIFSPRKIRTTSFLVLIICMVFMICGLVAFKDSSISQSIFKSVANIYDTIFGTNYSIMLGGDDITDSTNYRKLLPEIFKLDWLSPLVGRGISYKFSCVIGDYWIQSIDNFYVNQYIILAYPGLIADILIIISFINMIRKKAFVQKSAFYKVFFILNVCYFISLWWLDQLGTLSYIYLFFAFAYVHKDNKLI